MPSAWVTFFPLKTVCAEQFFAYAPRSNAVSPAFLTRAFREPRRASRSHPLHADGGVPYIHV